MVIRTAFQNRFKKKCRGLDDLHFALFNNSFFDANQDRSACNRSSGSIAEEYSEDELNLKETIC